MPAPSELPLFPKLSQTTPLLEPFFVKRACGRPRITRMRISKDDDECISWTQSYSAGLKEIRSDPLAWLAQICIRRSWVLRWNSLIDSSNRDAAEDDFKDPNCWFNRFLRMLRQDPVITIGSLHKNGFGISDFKDLGDLYSSAGEIDWNISIARLAGIDKRQKSKYEYRYFEVPLLFSRQQVRDAFEKWLDEEFPRHHLINFDDLRTIGVLQWIDLRIFELTTGQVVEDRIKLAIINATLPDPSEIRLSRVKLDGERDDLDITRTKVIKLMTDNTDFLADPVRMAHARLIDVWSRTNGRGNYRFVPALAEVDLKIKRFWAKDALDQEKFRPELEKLIQKLR